MVEWDIFISHASEDKASVARPLAYKLSIADLSVWLDESELFLGDSLRQKIDDGLHRSRFGIVILSPSFFSKEWPRVELDGMIAREFDGQKIILPVWHNVDADDVRKYSPILAGRLGVSTMNGLDTVVKKVSEAVRRVGRSRATGKPIFSGRLTKSVLMKLPAGSAIINNTVSPPDYAPTIMEQLGSVESREALWLKLRDAGENGRVVHAFGDLANLREYLVIRNNTIPDDSLHLRLEWRVTPLGPVIWDLGSDRQFFPKHADV